MGLWLALSSKLRTWLAAAGAVIVALIWAYFKGRSDKGHDQATREVNEYVETRRRLDDTTIPNDATDALDWLRKRQSGGDM
jgi:dienelactone hydrolase